MNRISVSFYCIDFLIALAVDSGSQITNTGTDRNKYFFIHRIVHTACGGGSIQQIINVSGLGNVE
ncbi:hypothetical protein [Paenibacillus sp. CMAA1364]